MKRISVEMRGRFTCSKKVPFGRWFGNSILYVQRLTRLSIISLWAMIPATSNSPATVTILYCPSDPRMASAVRNRTNPNPSERRNRKAVSSCSKLGTSVWMAFFPRLYVMRVKVAGRRRYPNILKKSIKPPFTPHVRLKNMKQRIKRWRRA